MNKRRLLKLADLLEADARDKTGIKFDLGVWGCSVSGPATVSCGTTACAMGLAALSGVFKEDGLRNRFGETSGSVIPRFTDRDITVTGLEAAQRLFGISRKASEWLFMEDHYRKNQRIGAAGERAVARRIRKFVAGEAKP